MAKQILFSPDKTSLVTFSAIYLLAYFRTHGNPITNPPFKESLTLGARILDIS